MHQCANHASVTVVDYSLVLVEKVGETIAELAKRDIHRYRRVIKCLGLLEQDPKYPGLASTRYQTLFSATGEPIWESYVENHTPSAWRVWWYYGPEAGTITVVDLGPHP